jgi:hypothetical protein
VLFLPLWIVLAQQQRKQQERVLEEQRAEEEDKTPYTERQLMEDWEFKIVRCSRPSFARPEFLAAVLAAEATAGWQLVEVFDGQRVRLKRPTSRRADDGRLPAGFDPYRLYVADLVMELAHARKVSRVLWVVCGLFAVAAAALAYAAATWDWALYILAGLCGAAALLCGIPAWWMRRR